MAVRWVRAVIPAALILIWLTVAGIGGPYFGRIAEVSTTDQTSFLPASSEATRVQNLLVTFRGDKTIPAIVVFARDAGATEADRRYADDTAIALASRSGVADGASPAIPSADGKAFEIILPLETGTAQATVKEIRATLSDKTPAGLSHHVTGPAGFTADLSGAFAGIDGVLLLVALAAVLLILLVVYRSPLLPLLVLGTTMFALTASILIVWWLAKAGVVTINGQVQGILFILVIGAATDYCLLYVSRYREALRSVAGRFDATLVALRGSLEPVLASGGTVIVGLLCLLLSDLNSNKALGPVAAIGVAMSVLAALTLLPALLLVFGRATFWPLRPKFHPNHAIESSAVPARGLWAAVGRLVARHARIVWVGATLLLLVASLGVFQLKADGVPQSDLILGVSQARDGQAVLGKHFAAGSGSPAIIVGDAGKIGELADAAAAVTGVGAVAAVAGDTGAATTPLKPGATGAPAPDRPGPPPADPRVVNGRVMLQATLTDAADSAAADRTILALRTALKTVDSSAIVGGATATAVDTNLTSLEDRNRIIPIVLAVILLILMLLLRSILAPVLLVASVIVSFGAALGVAALVFNGIFHFPGVDPSVPLFGFVFLVALGIDYNIFLMTRVREEALALGTRPGILRGLTVTGGVITSAGLVLAATFAALSVIPVLFLAQISFIVAFGVLLDTLLVRSLLVPALAYDIGRRVWWPSKLAHLSPGEAALAATAPASIPDAPHRASHAAPADDTDDTDNTAASSAAGFIRRHDAAHPAAHVAATGEVIPQPPINGTFEEVIAPPGTDPSAPSHESKESR